MDDVYNSSSKEYLKRIIQKRNQNNEIWKLNTALRAKLGDQPTTELRTTLTCDSSTIRILEVLVDLQYNKVRPAPRSNSFRFKNISN